METIKVDFIKREWGRFRKVQRIRFEENYNASMLP